VRYVPRALSIGGLLGGVALLSSGVYLLALNGQGTCDLTAAEKQCPRLYDTTGLGTGLVVGGSVVAIAGLVGLVWFLPGNWDSQVALGLSGSTLMVRGRF